MTKNHIKSSPLFYNLISRSFWLCILLLLLLAVIVPAPLQQQAMISEAPNPVKSAWFLLWIQELVSYRLWLIYPVIMVAALFLALPWLQRRPVKVAAWFGSSHRPLALLISILFLFVLILTVIGLFFRGENWALVWPF